MSKRLRPFLRHRRQLAVVASLAFATAVCVALLVPRAVYSQSVTHLGLVWNLFLAWLPMLSALAAYNLHQNHSRLSWLVIAVCSCVWLLFFPNAPYILTDILHLQPRENIPIWYDLIVLVAFAWTGTFLGLASLFLMQKLVHKTVGPLASWLFALGVLGLSGFGVYLGRFPRWNSWDVLVNPMSLLADIWQRIRHPLVHKQTFVFSLLFSLFFISTYLMLVAISQFQQETQRRSG